jgi:5-methylcytosine-specific restriction endonuclease McrA
VLANRIDRAKTKKRKYLDENSYVAFSGHEYLYGLDVEPRRWQVYNSQNGTCAYCEEKVTWKLSQLHHIEGGYGSQRCWCLHNLEILCKDCHKKKHVHPMWSKP